MLLLKKRLLVQCLVTFVFLSVILSGIFLYLGQRGNNLKTRRNRLGDVLLNKTESFRFYLQLLPSKIPTHIPRIPPPDAIDWNWFNYLNNTSPDRTFTFWFSRGVHITRARCMFGIFYHALILKRMFILECIDISYSPDGSSFGNWTQYFEPIHSQKYVTQVRPASAVLVSTAKSDPPDVPHLLGSVEYCSDEWQPGDTYLHQVALRLWRFNIETTRVIEIILSIFPFWSTRRYHAIHVHNYESYPIEHYCVALEKLSKTSNITDPVFISSDSEVNIEVFQKLRPNWNIWFIPATHLRRKEKLSTEEFDKMTYEFRVQFTYLLLAELTMMRYSHFYVGVSKSQVTELVQILRHPNDPHKPTVYSIDQSTDFNKE